MSALAEPVALRGGPVLVGASVGVATKTGKDGADQMVHQADVATYAAKAHGKGRVQVFETGLLDTGSRKPLTRNRQRVSDVVPEHAEPEPEPEPKPEQALALDNS